MKKVGKKILPWYFEAVRNGSKTFEIRKDEDGFEVGDHIILCEWSGTAYTGFTLEAEITYILRDAEQYGLMNGYCVFGIKAFDKDIDAPSKSALDHIHNVVKDDAYKRGYEQGKADAAPVVNANGNTFMIDVSEEDFDKIKRVIVGCGPMCRTFYEEGGEAHWIKSYTPDDGEIYECDNCGVTWQFNDGGPEENEAFYCPKCGFEMVRGEADGSSNQV